MLQFFRQNLEKKNSRLALAVNYVLYGRIQVFEAAQSSSSRKCVKLDPLGPPHPLEVQAGQIKTFTYCELGGSNEKKSYVVYTDTDSDGKMETITDVKVKGQMAQGLLKWK